ncbi:cyclin-dependent kinase G-1-like [Zea mays]|uniref:cyclin-dependent kinase G-1-like n=1 Tax=Zea mays TaxID=4577 RepID=UPI0009A9BC8F|nr:cyclin-dependent kinase G-1-like [Zea mays]|eukprot:XP_020398646.1 cyclin-dependent kinase G-1-like [Zea mays]
MAAARHGGYRSFDVARRQEFDLERSRRSKEYRHSSRHRDSDRHRDGSRGREVPNGYIRHRSPYAPLMSRPSKRKDDKELDEVSSDSDSEFGGRPPMLREDGGLGVCRDGGALPASKKRKHSPGFHDTRPHRTLAVLLSAAPQYKGNAKFKDGPLLHEEEKAIMYEDIRNRGDDHWAPSSGTTPQILEGETTENTDDKDGDYEANDDKDEDYEECEEVSPTTAKGKHHVSVGRKDKGKKPRSLGGHWVQDQLSKLVIASEKSTTSVESLARKEDNGCSIRDVMALVKECGTVPGTKEHFIASQVFVKRAEREMFMTLDTPEERFNWLTMKHDWVTRMIH